MQIETNCFSDPCDMPYALLSLGLSRRSLRLSSQCMWRQAPPRKFEAAIAVAVFAIVLIAAAIRTNAPLWRRLGANPALRRAMRRGKWRNSSCSLTSGAGSRSTPFISAPRSTGSTAGNMAPRCCSSPLRTLSTCGGSPIQGQSFDSPCNRARRTSGVLSGGAIACGDLADPVGQTLFV